MTAPRILFVANAGAAVGGGHVMRCLSLARALEAQGAQCAFVDSPSAAPILSRFGNLDHALLAMARGDDLAGLVKAAGDFTRVFAPHAIVIDHYDADASHEKTLASSGAKIVVIDDLANRPHAADLLVDPGYGRRVADYAGLVPEHCLRLAGPQYALLRPEFPAARPRALSRRAKSGPVTRAMVSLGLTDVGGITARVVEVIAPLMGEARLDVVLGAGATSLDSLTTLARQDRRIRLHIETVEMFALAADADLAVGGGGSSTWERACVGLPTISIVLAENQADMAAKMADAGLILTLDARAAGFEAALAQAWRSLIDAPQARAALSERSAAFCDGRGASRVADAILSLN